MTVMQKKSVLSLIGTPIKKAKVPTAVRRSFVLSHYTLSEMSGMQTSGGLVARRLPDRPIVLESPKAGSRL
jgi:hypothetical protein